MESLRATVKGAGIAACIMILPWMSALESGEQAGAYTETKLTASDGSPGDNFGSSVAISGETAVIGTQGPSVVYVFERDPLDPEVWIETVELTASDGDISGGAVAISGDTALLGANAADDLGSDAGAAYVFDRDPLDPKAWTETTKLTASDGSKSDFFGESVAISGGTVVIGAIEGYCEFDRPVGEQVGPGAAYVFERDPLDPTRWTETAKLTGVDVAIDSTFGASVAISGDTAVIGAPCDNPFGQLSGSVHVFERDPVDRTVWTQTARLTASDGDEGDTFGGSVAISGDTVLIGADFDDDLGFNAGAAYVFERNPLDPRVWTETTKLTASDGDQGDFFGKSVALSGEETAVIGAHIGDVLDTGGTGTAYVFERDPLDRTLWIETAKLAASDGAEGDQFGFSVAISGETVVIGANEDDDLGESSGSAYVYAPGGCDLELAVEPAALRAGEELRVAVDLVHRRPITVTVPLLLWIEDAAGRTVFEKVSPPIRIEPGDRLERRLAVTLPPGMPPGTYRVRVGVRRMQQGIAWGSEQIRVVE